jgi:hypothetical protein
VGGSTAGYLVACVSPVYKGERQHQALPALSTPDHITAACVSTAQILAGQAKQFSSSIYAGPFTMVGTGTGQQWLLKQCERQCSGPHDRQKDTQLAACSGDALSGKRMML